MKLAERFLIIFITIIVSTLGTFIYPVYSDSSSSFVVDQYGHIVIGGDPPPASPSAIYVGERVSLTDNNDYNGVYVRQLFDKVGTDYSGHAVGLAAEILMDNKTARNFSDTRHGGLIGVYSAVQTADGSMGTVFKAVAYEAVASIMGAVTNQYIGFYAKAPYSAQYKLNEIYQIYIEAPTVGNVKNYALYSEGGRFHIGGNDTLEYGQFITDNVTGAGYIRIRDAQGVIRKLMVAQ